MIELTDSYGRMYAKLTLLVGIGAQIDILPDLWTSVHLEIKVQNNVEELICVHCKEGLLLPWTEKKSQIRPKLAQHAEKRKKINILSGKWKDRSIHYVT